MLFCYNQEVLGVEFLFHCCGRFHFCQLHHSQCQFYRARAPFDRSEHQKYLCDDKKGMDFQHGKNCCVCTSLYIFVSIYIYLRVRVCVLFIWIYICMYVHKYITHTLIENKNLAANGPCLLCVSPTVKQT